MCSLFSSYAAFVGSCADRHADVAEKLGMERDEVRELRDILWALEDAYKVDEENDNVGMEADED